MKKITLIFDYYYDIEKLYLSGNDNAKSILQSWANAEWFISKPEVADKISLCVFKVPGETNTDDLSPAVDAWSRPDIPLHSLSMLKNPRDGIIPDKPGEVGPISLIESLKK